MPTPTMALSYTDTEFDFQSWTNDVNGVGTLTNGFIQDCNDDLDGTDGWTAGTNVTSEQITSAYEGSYAANVSYSGTSAYGTLTKEFTFSTSSGHQNLYLAIWLNGSKNSDNKGYSYIEIRFSNSHGPGAPNLDSMRYVLANSTTFSNEFANETTYDDFGDSYQYYGAIRVGDCNAAAQYLVRNVTSDFYACRSRQINSSPVAISEMDVYIGVKDEYQVTTDVMLISIHDTIKPLPEPQVTGSAKGFYNESGLCLETGSGESAYAQIDYTDFSDKWDYGIKVTYGGTGTSTNVSSSLNVDAAGWSDWNKTISTLGNNSFKYYTISEGYSGEDIHGRYLDIDCPASSSIIIKSLTIRTGMPGGGGGLFGGGGGGGVAPETVAKEVVSELTAPIIFGIQYWQLIALGVGAVFIVHKSTKKKIHYRLPIQSQIYVSVISGILLAIFWITLSIFYMEAPPKTLAELPLLFYIIGLVVPLILVPVSKSIKMQGVERAPNKFVFQSHEFMPSISKGIIILTGVSFVIYYLLNFTIGFKARSFLVTQLPQEIVAFQLGATTTWFLHFILPFIEESVFRFWVPQMIAPYTNETHRALISAGVFGAFHYYVAQTLGWAYFIYFFCGGLIFYTICYGSLWLEKIWKGTPKILQSKGAGIMAAIIVHLIFNFLALYGASLLETAWVVEV